MKRIKALRQSAFSQNSFDSFIIFNDKNLIYLTGCMGANALIVYPEGDSTLFVSPVNYEMVKTEAKGFSIELVKRGENLMEKVAGAVNAPEIKKLAVDSLGITSWRTLAKAVGGEEKLEPANYVEKLRQVKDEEEIQLIREACKLAGEGMKVASEIIKPGLTEIQVAAEIEYAMRKKGSYGCSFETIVASGPNSAFPHSMCSKRVIHEGDLVVVDLGANYKFYCSDMTRTFVAGKPTEKQKAIFETVKLAHHEAFEAIMPGIPVKDVDALARKGIDEAGFAEFFVHNLGHGIGLEVHELPILNPLSKDILVAGMVVTDEPGIYLPGYGGVRIEDTVLTTKDGADKLTQGPYLLETT